MTTENRIAMRKVVDQEGWFAFLIEAQRIALRDSHEAFKRLEADGLGDAFALMAKSFEPMIFISGKLKL
jgi:hypothetical protein